MDKELKNHLLQFDDATESYAPQHFDYLNEMERVRNVKKLLEERTGYKFEIDKYVQDASYFTVLFNLDESQQLVIEHEESYNGL